MVIVTLVQVPINDLETNLKRILSYMKKAKGTDIIMFPEFALQEYTGKIEDQPNWEELGGSLAKISSACKKYSMYAIIPTVVREGNERFNRSLLFNRKGEIVYQHTKQRLFWKERDHAKASAGSGNKVVDTDFGKIGILQCFEIYNTERAELVAPLANAGAQILFVPSDSIDYDWPGAENKDEIIAAPQVIARDFKIPVVVCDSLRLKKPWMRAGTISPLDDYSLCLSKVVDKNGNIIEMIQGVEKMITIKIDL